MTTLEKAIRTAVSELIEQAHKNKDIEEVVIKPDIKIEVKSIEYEVRVAIKKTNQ